MSIRISGPLIACVTLLGCARPQYATIDEACEAVDLSDAEGASEAAVEAITRMNCYRLIAGMRAGGIDEGVQAAVEAHTAYMSQNDEFTDSEDPDLPGFTGEDVYTRLEAAGVPLDGFTGLAWPLAAIGVPDPAAIVDATVDDPYTRQIVLDPGWLGAGFAEVGDYSYGNVLVTIPAWRNARDAFVYPADGQQDVPTSYTFDYGLTAYDDGIPDKQEVGYPITITVGSNTEWLVSESNLYGLVYNEVALTGPSGEVELYTVEPGEYEAPYPLAYTLVAVPTAPLEPDAEYTFTATITWTDGTRGVASTFRTLPE